MDLSLADADQKDTSTNYSQINVKEFSASCMGNI